MPFPCALSVVANQDADHGRVDEVALAEIDEQVAPDRLERVLDLDRGGEVVFAAEFEDCRVAARLGRGKAELD